MIDQPMPAALNQAVDEARLWNRHMAMARIGATGSGGVNRQALSVDDTRGRILFLEWANMRGRRARMDSIGNLFIRRGGRDDSAAPVVTGSHLDSQPTGGNFDGVFGVLAGLEVLDALDDIGASTARPIELAVWTFGQ